MAIRPNKTTITFINVLYFKAERSRELFAIDAWQATT
jgi:hypothetical protein